MSFPKFYNEVDDRDEIARLQSFVDAIATADLVKNPLGLKGIDKIIVFIGGK